MRSISIAGLACAILISVAAARADGAKPSPAAQCENGLKAANKELDFARAKGLGGTVEFSKAATLLAGAKVQSEFHKWPNCIEKVRRARRFLAKSRK
ncbi:MAG TPA: hypothetical protein VLX30_14770 [Burkholderiales bacterium]|nr:hypothetical protein [Burkholderiales bacterium]